MNKTRHSESPATTQFVRPREFEALGFLPNLPVWVRIWDGYGGRGWVEGTILYTGRGLRHFYRGNKGIGEYRVAVHIKDETTGEMIVPRTINEHLDTKCN